MRLAVMGDIHSNSIAFEACIKDIEKSNVDGICLIGDYISDCPKPQTTINMIKDLQKKYKVWMIKGNREDYFIRHDDGIDDGWDYSSYQGSLLYTYEALRPEDIDFIRSLPLKCRVHIPGTDPLLLVHGSQKNVKELLFANKDNTRERLVEMDEIYLLSGHTHQRTYYEYNGKYLINPGSVGVAVGDKRTAHYCILEWNSIKWDVDFRNIPYDTGKLYEAFMNSSLMEKGGVWPICILKSVEEGINWGPLCSKRAYDMAVEEDMEVKNRNVPDKFWLLAAKELGIIVERVVSD